MPVDNPTTARSYYRNSLRAWRDDLLKQRRQLMARYAVMERLNHPDRRDQGYLLEINEEAIANIDRALTPLDAAALKARSV